MEDQLRQEQAKENDGKKVMSVWEKAATPNPLLVKKPPPSEMKKASV